MQGRHGDKVRESHHLTTPSTATVYRSFCRFFESPLHLHRSPSCTVTPSSYAVGPPSTLSPGQTTWDRITGADFLTINCDSAAGTRSRETPTPQTNTWLPAYFPNFLSRQLPEDPLARSLINPCTVLAPLKSASQVQRAFFLSELSVDS